MNIQTSEFYWDDHLPVRRTCCFMGITAEMLSSQVYIYIVCMMHSKFIQVIKVVPWHNSRNGFNPNVTEICTVLWTWLAAIWLFISTIPPRRLINKPLLQWDEFICECYNPFHYWKHKISSSTSRNVLCLSASVRALVRISKYIYTECGKMAHNNNGNS
jgi:hypothetical protein